MQQLSQVFNEWLQGVVGDAYGIMAPALTLALMVGASITVLSIAWDFVSGLIHWGRIGYGELFNRGPAGNYVSPTESATYDAANGSWIDGSTDDTDGYEYVYGEGTAAADGYEIYDVDGEAWEAMEESLGFDPSEYVYDYSGEPEMDSADLDPEIMEYYDNYSDSEEDWDPMEFEDMSIYDPLNGWA